MKKNLLRTILKLCGFFIIANLPFLTISQLIGIDTFIDSFNHPSSFYYIKNEKIPNMDSTAGYIILEKPPYQASVIREGDSILCHTIKNTLQQRIVSQIQTKEGITTYYTISYSNTIDAPIYESQILGKIIGTSEDNIWYALCLQVWKLSIEKLNVFVLFSVG
jgi:hypothetical protein